MIRLETKIKLNLYIKLNLALDLIKADIIEFRIKFQLGSVTVTVSVSVLVSDWAKNQI